MVLAAYRDDVYNVFLFLHIVAAIVAFAPAVVHPLTLERLRGEPALGRVAAIAADNGRKVYFPALIVLGILGIVLLVLGGEVVEFSQLWATLAFISWIAICGIVSAIIMPNERKVAAGDEDAQKKVATGGQIATLLVLFTLYLMVFKPT